MASINSEGYRLVYRRGHPLASRNGSVLEHRAVLYDALGEGPHRCHWCGRQLVWKGGPTNRVNVDHLDDDPANNDPANLVPACIDCNSRRSWGRKALEEFAAGLLASAPTAHGVTAKQAASILAGSFRALAVGLRERGGPLYQRTMPPVDLAQIARFIERAAEELPKESK